ncbi:L,D-transpeptidase family protein [uncultured Sneathiella sp.]|uniref:L,D-transpeptidase family protein n=1 Tax=uncultured Sneathiella sp. TaxID=879315 RepID=UPI0030EBDB71|tara:strand:+ start:18631 stop:19143 length:513 start_codon:yes stop_codon:yes gene_type:complete
MDIYVTQKEGSRGLLTYNDLAFDCALGKSGVTPAKREGDHASPEGRFALRKLLYRADRVAKPETILPAQAIDRNDGWCDDPDHEAYNRPVRLPFAARHETLWREDELYDLVVVLGHNDDPVVKGAGSCIFMHVARKDYGPTEGCVALEKADLLKLLAAIEGDTAIRIAAS